MTQVAYRRIDVDGVEVFYREAGSRGRPTLLLLHGFPTSGHMFRDLIPMLADRYHVVAPDLPGFGQSAMPLDGAFAYSFENLARVIGRFTEVVRLPRFALYVFDYGAPVGLRLALQHPERITALISQNGNIYEEGLSAGWDAMKSYWAAPTQAYRESLRAAFTPDATRYQYLQGVDDPGRVSPDGPALDDLYLARPGAHEVQLDLFTDYGANVALYPQFQAYLREHRPPVLAVWGDKDPYFLPAGALAFRRDAPDAEVHFFPTGHFALETHGAEIARAIETFLGLRLRTETVQLGSVVAGLASAEICARRLNSKSWS
ncbi:MAG: alpha/beta hydrolase [Caulobacteraceae bacterium]